MSHLGLNLTTSMTLIQSCAQCLLPGWISHRIMEYRTKAKESIKSCSVYRTYIKYILPRHKQILKQHQQMQLWVKDPNEPPVFFSFPKLNWRGGTCCALRYSLNTYYSLFSILFFSSLETHQALYSISPTTCPLCLCKIKLCLQKAKDHFQQTTRNHQSFNCYTV